MIGIKAFPQQIGSCQDLREMLLGDITPKYTPTKFVYMSMVRNDTWGARTFGSNFAVHRFLPSR